MSDGKSQTTAKAGKWPARFASIEAAIAQRDEFHARVREADGDAMRLADLMAEAIDMQVAANGLEVVGRDSRALVRVEDIAAAHCLIAARDAYRCARGVNHG